MENSVGTGYRYYKVLVQAFNGFAEVVTHAGRGTIKVEMQIGPGAGSFGSGYISVWLTRWGGDGKISFLIGAVPADGESRVVQLKRNFYTFDVAGTGSGIEDFNELVVTIEKDRRPVIPGAKELLRHSIGCFAGRRTLRNPLFCELRPFYPPLRNYRWWGVEGNLCTDSRVYDYPVNRRKKGV